MKYHLADIFSIPLAYLVDNRLMLQGEVLCQLVLKYKGLPTFKKNLKLVKNGPHKHKEDYLKPIEYRLTVAAVECNLYVNTQAIKSKRL